MFRSPCFIVEVSPVDYSEASGVSSHLSVGGLLRNGFTAGQTALPEAPRAVRGPFIPDLPAGIELKNGFTDRTLKTMQTVFEGPVYVVRDNIDTDQIIPAQYLNLVPTIAEEYEKLGSFALCGLPESLYATRFVKPGQMDSEYPIVVGGRNFGCGSSREHAPIALGSAGCRVVLAESFARIFFRNSVATGELYPCELAERLCDVLKTGDVVRVDLEKETVTVKQTGKEFRFKPLGDVKPVVDAGGLFNYARKTGMIPA